ncbi:MAG: type II toxin-antitoxin system VapC family toxin [Vulcanimicrobiota bacterium]
MITVLDTGILLDVFLPDPVHGEKSLMLLKRAYDGEALIICEIVYAELVPQFLDRKLLNRALQKINISIQSIDQDVAYCAGERWALYRKSGGERERIISDFLIGAHALHKAERFLTRDRGFYASYFKNCACLMMKGTVFDELFRSQTLFYTQEHK